MVNFYLSLSTMLVFLGYGYGFWQNRQLLRKNIQKALWNSAVVPTEENSRKTGFLARINTTRRELPGKPDLQMKIVVKGGFGDGTCGKGESGHNKDPKSAVEYGDRGKKGTMREHLLR